MQTTYEFNKGCEYSWSRSFHDDLILQDQASGERCQDQWSSGLLFLEPSICIGIVVFIIGIGSLYIDIDCFKPGSNSMRIFIFSYGST